LEFVIKSYPDHHGVIEQIGKVKPDDVVKMKGPPGPPSDREPDISIASSAGFTPMIAIMRKRLQDHGTLAGSTLLFAYKTEADIIRRDLMESMVGLKTASVVDQPGASVPQKRLHRDYLNQFVGPDSH